MAMNTPVNTPVNTPHIAAPTQIAPANDADTAPVFASWWGWYGLIVGVFVVLVGLFGLFTQMFR